MLKRDYQKEPIIVGERIPKDDLYELYMERNLNLEECSKILGCSKAKVSHNVVFYGFKKTKEQTNAMMKRLTLQKYGVESTNQLQSTKDNKKKTFLERYGCNMYINSEQGRKTIKETNLKRFGTENSVNRPEVKEKLIY